MMVKLFDSGDCEGLFVFILFLSLVRICLYFFGDGWCLMGGFDVIFYGYLLFGYDVVILDVVLLVWLIYVG